MIKKKEKNLSLEELKKITLEIMRICKPFSAKVILNSCIEVADDLNVDGVHLNSIELQKFKKKTKNIIVSASCHSEEDVKIAQDKCIDFVVLSAVNKTISHPRLPPMGWSKFLKISNKFDIPIYALGGMKKNHINIALDSGAIGIASQRDIWLN